MLRGFIMSKYWIPSTKKDLIKWLSSYFASNKKQIPPLRTMELKQIYAIYYSIRERIYYA